MVAMLKDQEEIIFLNTQRVFFKKNIYTFQEIYTCRKCAFLSDRRKYIHPVSHLHVCCGIDQFNVLDTPRAWALFLQLL